MMWVLGKWPCAAVLVLTWAVVTAAQSVEDCLMCHQDPELTVEHDGREISLFVDAETFLKSVHGEFECIACHTDLAEVEFPHREEVEPVDCGICHGQVAEIYRGSLHGQAVEAGAKLAPSCWDCHGAHDILTVQSPDSKVARFNVPFVCGRCHKEGTEVTRTYDIP